MCVCLVVVSIFLGEASLIGRAHGTAGRVVHHGGDHPLVAVGRVILAHHAVAGLGVPAHLHAAHAAVAHALDGLGAPYVLGGSPHGLRQVGISVPAPVLLVVHESLRDLVGGVQPSPLPRSLVLGEVLTLVGIVVLDAGGIARAEELLGVDLCVPRQGL